MKYLFACELKTLTQNTLGGKMKKLILTIALFITVACCFAENISREKVNSTKLKNWLQSTYGCSIVKKGKLRIANGSATVYMSLLPEKKLIKIFAHCTRLKSASEVDSIKFISKWNSSKIFLRVSYDKKSKTFDFDYYMSYAGGLSSKNVITSLEWFFEITSYFMQEASQAGLI